jgi:FtsZ-interacting cell division protein ZipA
MSTHNIVWIVIAVLVAVVVLAAVIFAANRASRQRRQRQAEEIREQARLEAGRVERRQAVADETAAKARAAQAEAEAKAAEAARLQERAAMHHNEASTSRDRLQEQWERADSLDPAVKAETPDTDESAHHSGGAAHHAGEASHEPTTEADAVGHHDVQQDVQGSETYRDTGHRSTPN